MKRNARMQTERKSQYPTVTGSKGRNPWNDVDDPELEFDDPEDRELEEDSFSKRRGNTRLLTMIQIIACTAILVAAVVLRLRGGEPFQTVRSWYFESLNNSIVADSQVDHVRHVVVDLWSTISSSRAENSQTPSSNQSQIDGTALQNSSSALENSVAPGTSSQNLASAPVSSASSSENSAAAASSADQNSSSPSVSS
ncbi:MAG: hypothetical protein LKJ17_00610 [Oscillospiraceae bacterium]|jgi:hypothetical protein|nr:hypothetical protein [Oscillospiraceae bacterium]